MQFNPNLDLYSQIHMAELQRDADYRASWCAAGAQEEKKTVSVEDALAAAFDGIDDDLNT